VPDEQMAEAEAEWDSAGRLIRMRESVFIGMNRNEPRARMGGRTRSCCRRAFASAAATRRFPNSAKG
jgi:hypothetical protein